MSLSVYFAIHILSRSGWEGTCPWRMTISMEMSHHGFIFKFSELKYKRKRVRFSPCEFFSYAIKAVTLSGFIEIVFCQCMRVVCEFLNILKACCFF